MKEPRTNKLTYPFHPRDDYKGCNMNGVSIRLCSIQTMQLRYFKSLHGYVK